MRQGLCAGRLVGEKEVDSEILGADLHCSLEPTPGPFTGAEVT